MDVHAFVYGERTVKGVAEGLAGDYAGNLWPFGSVVFVYGSLARTKVVGADPMRRRGEAIVRQA